MLSAAASINYYPVLPRPTLLPFLRPRLIINETRRDGEIPRLGGARIRSARSIHPRVPPGIDGKANGASAVQSINRPA